MDGKGLIIITGPSGVGKTTLLWGLESDAVSIHAKATTRLPRLGEIPGKDFYFMEKERLESEEFLLQFERYGGYYGIYEDQIVNALRHGQLHIITIMSFGTIYQLKRLFPNATVVSIMAEPAILKQRLRERLSRFPHPRDRLLLNETDKVYDLFSAEHELFDQVVDNSGSIQQGVERLRYEISKIASIPYVEGTIRWGGMAAENPYSQTWTQKHQMGQLVLEVLQGKRSVVELYGAMILRSINPELWKMLLETAEKGFASRQQTCHYRGGREYLLKRYA